MLQELISAEHFDELKAYDRLKAPESVRMEFYLSRIAQLIHNANVAKPSDARPQSDFLLDRPRPKKLRDDAFFEALVALTVSMGGTVDGDYRQAQHDVHG